MKRVAFVIPWFGKELVGGAEQHIFQVATRLAKRGHEVEVLTTCCRSFQDDWQRNHLPEGTSEESGVRVRRFPVRARNVPAFDEANRQLIELNEKPKPPGVPPVSRAAESAFVEQNIHSPKLLEFISRERQRYAAIVFSPYLYGPTLLGVERAADHAFLQPLLHDETYAYLPAVERLFHSARRVLFISEGEARLAARLYGPSMWRKGVVAGGGMEAGEAVAAESPLSAPFILCLGRRDRTKNTDLLLRAFAAYRRRGGKLQLALAGPGEVAPGQDGVVDLRLVSEPVKAALLRDCRALLQPSINESYSRTMMEAWRNGRPVVVHGHCLATSGAVELCGGGWVASSDAEWAEAISTVENAPETELKERGENGRAYAREHADWDKAIDRYEQALELRPRAVSKGSPRRRLRAVHQLVAGLDWGDAISNQALFIKEVLRGLGYESSIFVQHVADAMRDHGKPFESGDLRPGDGVLYHYGIGSPLTAAAIRHQGPKALVYHNITPPHFFASWDPAFAKLLQDGLGDLHHLAPAFPASSGDSQFNADELRSTGFRDPGVLPIFVDPMRWSGPADAEWMKMLQDGRSNLLFVGRVAPNKCQHHLLEAFKEYLVYDRRARLLMVGSWPPGHPYARHLQDQIEKLGLKGRVFMPARVTDAQLQACYRTAHLFWSMSEHEGFCVPLIEAMWFDVPVLAFRSSAIPETLGPAGLMFTEKTRWPELAALAHLMVTDAALRRKILAAQRARRGAFLPEAVLPRLFELLRKLGDEPRVAVENERPLVVRRDELPALGAEPALNRKLV